MSPSKRLQALKQKSKKRRSELAAEHTPVVIEDMDAQLQSEYFWGNVNEHFAGLTKMEIKDIKPNASHFAASDSKHTLEGLPKFIRSFFPNYKTVFGKQKGPKKGIKVIVICASAVRSVEVLK